MSLDEAPARLVIGRWSSAADRANPPGIATYESPAATTNDRSTVGRGRMPAAVMTGVDAGAIKVVGARDSQPLGDNSTPEGRDMNRYADIVVE